MRSIKEILEGILNDLRNPNPQHVCTAESPMPFYDHQWWTHPESYFVRSIPENNIKIYRCPHCGTAFELPLGQTQITS